MKVRVVLCGANCPGRVQHWAWAVTGRGTDRHTQRERESKEGDDAGQTLPFARRLPANFIRVAEPPISGLLLLLKATRLTNLEDCQCSCGHQKPSRALAHHRPKNLISRRLSPSAEIC